jgi:6-methylsalicylate decarboxylase
MQRIDIHQHFLPPFYIAALAERGIKLGAELPFLEWDVQSALALMERNGIASAMVSISEPGIYFGDALAARDLARRCNEYAADLIRAYPSRFGAFAILPLPDVDAALRELEYALDTLHLDGVIVFSNSAGRYPGDPLFDELFSELQRRKAVVFIHPAVPAINHHLQLDLPPFLVEFVFDTTRAIVNLLFSGTLDRCPDIRFIAAHAGGTVPYLAYRIAMGQLVLPAGASQGAITYLKQLYYDVALSASPFVLHALQQLVDASHILFGSDYPFAPELATDFVFRGLARHDGFDEAARAMIERENALALFPRVV